MADRGSVIRLLARGLCGARRRFRGTGTDRGFTLVEMIVTLFLVVMVLGSFLTVTIGAIAATRLGEERVRANQLAQEQLEKLKAIPWASLGMYETDPGYSADPACPPAETESRVLITATPRVPDTVMPLPTTTLNRGGLNYTVATCVTWSKSGNTGADYDSKHIAIAVSWTDHNVRSITANALRAPTAAEVPPPNAGSAPESLVLHPTATPMTRNLDSAGNLTGDISLAVTTPAGMSASTVIVAYANQAGQQSLPLTSSDGLNWSGSLSASSGPFNPGQELLSFTARGNGAPATGSVTVTLTAPAPPPLTLTVTATPPSQTLTADGHLTAAIGLTATTDLAAASVSVRYDTADGPQTPPLTGGPTSWSLSLPTTTGTYLAGTRTFTFTAQPATGGSAAVQTASVTLAAPPQPAIAINSFTVAPVYTRGLCVDKQGGGAFNNQTATITVANLSRTDKVEITWTNPNNGPFTAQWSRTDASGAQVFTLNLTGSGKTFNGSTTVFTVKASRSVDQAAANQSFPWTVQINPNENQCS